MNPQAISSTVLIRQSPEVELSRIEESSQRPGEWVSPVGRQARSETLVTRFLNMLVLSLGAMPV